MQVLLAISRGIDALNERVGRVVLWLVLAMVLVSSGNAVVALCLQPQLERLARAAVVPVRGGVPALRRATPCCTTSTSASTWSRRGSRAARRSGSTSSARCSSCCRWRSFIMWLSWPIFMNAWVERRDLEQCRRPDPLAGAAAGAGRLPAADAAGRLGADQAHRVPARAHSRSGGEARDPAASSSCKPTSRGAK